MKALDVLVVNVPTTSPAIAGRVTPPAGAAAGCSRRFERRTQNQRRATKHGLS